MNPLQFERARGKGSLILKKSKSTGGLTSVCQPEKAARKMERDFSSVTREIEWKLVVVYIIVC